MKQLDFDVLEKDADDYTILLIDLWLHGVTFDGVFSHDTLSDSLYGKLRPRVLEVLSSDTQVDYPYVRDILGTEARPEIQVTARNRWGESQFLNAMREQLDRVQAQLQCAIPVKPGQKAIVVNTPSSDPEPMRLSRYILKKWVNGICSDEKQRTAMEAQLLPQVLSWTTEYWNTPRNLPKDDVIYWFDEYMDPAAAPFVRKDWSVEQTLKDIEMTFVTLNSKLVFEEQMTQSFQQRTFNSAVEQRRSKNSTTTSTKHIPPI